MENGEHYSQKPAQSETQEPQVQLQPPEQEIKIITKPTTESFAKQMSEQVQQERAQTPTTEKDYRDETPDAATVGSMAAPRTHPSENSVLEIGENYQKQSRTDEGQAAREANRTVTILQREA